MALAFDANRTFFRVQTNISICGKKRSKGLRDMYKLKYRPRILWYM